VIFQVWFKNRRAKCRQVNKSGKKTDPDKLNTSPIRDSYSRSSGSPGSHQSNSPPQPEVIPVGNPKQYPIQLPGMPNHMSGIIPPHPQPTWGGYPSHPAEHASVPYTQSGGPHHPAASLPMYHQSQQNGYMNPVSYYSGHPMQYMFPYQGAMTSQYSNGMQVWKTNII
jgi:hypothetical protein